MRVIVNGDRHELDTGTRVEDVLVLLGHDRRGLGLAVAVNGQVVPRSDWGERKLEESDRIEVLHAIGGG